MKRYRQMPFISSSVLLLLACVGPTFFATAENWTNVFLVGQFYGADENNESISCLLTVQEISKEAYEESNGINVVYDLVGSNYYSLDFRINDSEGNQQIYILTNFQSYYLDGKGTPTMVYYAEQGFYIYPYNINKKTTPSWNYQGDYNIWIYNTDRIVEFNAIVYACEE